MFYLNIIHFNPAEGVWAEITVFCWLNVRPACWGSVTHVTQSTRGDITWGSWRLKSPTTALFLTVSSGARQRKHKNPLYWLFVIGTPTDDLWSPITWGQLRGKCFRVMTSSWRQDAINFPKLYTRWLVNPCDRMIEFINTCLSFCGNN